MDGRGFGTRRIPAQSLLNDKDRRPGQKRGHGSTARFSHPAQDRSPTNVVITGIDKPEILDQAFQAAKTFKRLEDEEFAALVAKTSRVASTGEYELFKVSAHFDGTARHPDWLGGDDPAVQKLLPRPPVRR
jgi:hypothetical protein